MKKAENVVVVINGKNEVLSSEEFKSRQAACEAYDYDIKVLKSRVNKGEEYTVILIGNGNVVMLETIKNVETKIENEVKKPEKVERTMDPVVKRYNDIMMACCREYLTIGTQFSENTDGWGIREMVRECKETLETYYEEGHANEEMRHDKYTRKVWISETGKLKRFIKAYEHSM